MKPQSVTGALVAASFVLTGFSAHASWFITDLGTLGGSTSRASAINNNGQVVGAMGVDNTSGTTAFLYENGTVTNLGHLPGGENFPGGIYSAAPEIDGSNAVLGMTLLGGLLSLKRRGNLHWLNEPEAQRLPGEALCFV